MLFRKIDSFHFDSVGTAWLTMLASEIMGYTDMIMPNVMGCATYVCGGWGGGGGVDHRQI